MARALIIGINDYAQFPLRGSVPDAIAMNNLLSRHHDGSVNYDCKLITSAHTNVTLKKLRENIHELFRSPDDRVLFYFSGHGYENNLEGFLVAQNAEKFMEGLPVSELLALANDALTKRKIKEVTLILDCCHAGHLGAIPGMDTPHALLSPGLSVLTSSSSKELSIETKEGGLFTRILCEGLNGGAADILGRVTAASLYNYVDQMLGAWQQRPQFKTHTDRMHLIRKANLRLTLKELHQITAHFITPDSKVKMDKSWEETEKEFVKQDNVKKFKLFKKYRDAGLLKPCEPDEDLYWAAMNKGAAELTLSGKLYWKMVTKGII
ncbi:MAG: caspase family protein [Bacteroidia bacterium]|nr:caspase family protein [Bacteroidia bacterium]